MDDIVNQFDEWATSLGWKFDYGTKAMLNLLKDKTKIKTIHFLLSSPIEWNRENATFGPGAVVSTGSFLLVVKSDLRNVTYKNGQPLPDESKYVKNIVPLMDELKRFEKLLSCSEYDVKSFKAIDGYNMLDSNTDGLVVTFTISKQ